MQQPFKVRFWGVRGSAPTPGTNTIRYGGQTSCVEMRCGDQVLIFDAGTGIFPMGEQQDLKKMQLFLSHTHIDHILGFPFFSPAYQKGMELDIWAGHLKADGYNLYDTLSRVMSPPIFPLTLDFLKADIRYHDFNAGETLTHLTEHGIEIQTLPLNHPDRATAYRVNYAGHSACYVTDVEHIRDGLNQALIAFIRDADVFIYDSTFDDASFDRFVGWGHSTWQEGVRLAEAANVKSLVLFHHDPNMGDNGLDERLEKLRSLRPNHTDYVAREGLSLVLNP
tara:strand:+ start:3780 stop:4619 length:840 start_codon:yes stop_codon:yes gene_type:complete